MNEKDVARHLSEYKRHIQTLSTGGKLIRLQGRLYDYFHGTRGWRLPTRFRVLETTTAVAGCTEKQIEYVSGYEMDPKLQALILVEMKV